MTVWAKVEEGRVIELALTNPVDPDDQSKDTGWVEVPAEYALTVTVDDKQTETLTEVETGPDETDIVVGVGFEPDDLKVGEERLLALLATHRWNEQVYGIKFKGHTYNSTSDTLTELNSRITNLGNTPSVEEDAVEVTRGWKTPEGWVDLTIEDMKAIQWAISTHVQHTFDMERDVSKLISAEKTFLGQLKVYHAQVSSLGWKSFDKDNYEFWIDPETLPPAEGQPEPEAPVEEPAPTAKGK